VQLTPRDDVRKAASEILKRVDQLIKAGEIERSVREIIRAKEIDPTNVYIHAYEERLAYLKVEHEKNAEQERTRKQAEEAARKRDAELRRQLEQEQQRRTEELARQETARKKQEEQIRLEQEQARATAVREPVPPPAPKPDAEKAYVDALRKAWSAGNITPQQSMALQKLRTEIGISPERQLQIDSKILSEIQSAAKSDTILVIDDDKEMLMLISEMLTLHGYQVTALTTSDEAYTLLKNWKPRLILSDVNLETSTMGGFTFFEKARELKHLLDVPFIFLTGLSDEAIVRTGKELGVDDYLTKPISEENLIAAVKGKLKRFGHLGNK
jgi:CheY-like chemotaxis protein